MFLVQELQDLKTEKKQLQQRCEQQEQALQEMGLHLSQLVPTYKYIEFPPYVNLKNFSSQNISDSALIPVKGLNSRWRTLRRLTKP